MPTLIDLAGQTFGRLTVLAKADSQRVNGQTRPTWLCECSCGATVTVLGMYLRDGQTVSCGCRMRETGRQNRKQVVGHAQAHARLMRERGKAKYHACADCAAPAAHWAYDHSDPDELVEESFVNGVLTGRKVFSTKPNHYSPKCAKCNRADRRHLS